MGKSKIGRIQIFTGRRHGSQLASIGRPLAISSPVGPVKNSRGPDFTRSESLMIVDAIKDCGPSQADDEDLGNSSLKHEKRIAIGMLAKKALLKRQSLATLATTPKKLLHSSATAPRSNCDRDEIDFSISNLHGASLSTTTAFTASGDAEYTHTSPPQALNSPEMGNAKIATNLPKSRTMNVLQDIKNSVPRRTKIPTSASKTLSKKSDPSLKQIEMPMPDFLRSLRRRSREESVSSSRHSSTTNITTPDSTGQPFENVKAEILPGHISHAQPSAYWAGRFTTLRDRFSTDHMNQVLAKATDTIQNGVLHHYSSDDISHDAELSGIPPYPLQDEDTLCLRVFSHLEAQCLTKAAKESLRRWQEKYARRRRRPDLLPQGSALAGESHISKRFASYGRYQDRQGLAYIEDAYYSNASNAFGVTNPHSLEARYLNFR